MIQDLDNLASLDQITSVLHETTPTKTPKSKKNIPIPIIHNVPNYEHEVPADYNIPTSYVRFQRLPIESDETSVDVDLETEDMVCMTKMTR